MSAEAGEAIKSKLRIYFIEVTMVPTTRKLMITDSAIHIEQGDSPRSPKEVLPTMYDLPSEDPEEPGLPDEFHDLQPQLLSRTLRWCDREGNWSLTDPEQERLTREQAER